jgi:rod shape-determining protein MreC
VGVYFLPLKIKTAIIHIPARVLLVPFNWTKSQSLNIIKLKQDNEKLSQLVGELQLANTALREDQRRTIAEVTLAGFVFKRARVVGRDPQTLVRTVLINRGEKDGFKTGMAVMGGSALLGKIIETGPEQSLVETVLSPTLRIGALDQRSRVVGVVKGPALAMDYVALDEDVRIGDTVVTSGLGDLFPPGLPIGVIAAIDDGTGGIFKRIKLTTLVRVAAVEQVSVITSVTEQPRTVEAIAESAATRKMEKIRRVEFKKERPPEPTRRIEASQPF